MAVLFAAIITTSSAAIFILYRAKSKLEKKIKHGKNSENVIYEEIKQIPQFKMDTSVNVAYTSRNSVIHSASRTNNHISIVAM